MNKAMFAENQGLAYDNKQLNGLIKEYEQGLEVVMSMLYCNSFLTGSHFLSGDFRNRAVSLNFVSREIYCTLTIVPNN